MFPKEKIRVPVELDKNSEIELKDAINNIEKIVSMETAPEPKKCKFCRNCAYNEFCWV